MQNKKRTAFRADLRPPLIAAACIGIVLLLTFTALTLFLKGDELLLYGLALCGLYVISVGAILVPYLVRHSRVTAANDAAELMATEISDMFRYVADIPYAVIS
jgi:hypothetical protein